MLAAPLLLAVLLLTAPGESDASIPTQPGAAGLEDPLAVGPYTVDRSYYYAGTLQLTVTSTGQTTNNCSPTTIQYGQSSHCPGQTFPQPLEGSVTYPTNNPNPSKVILLLHGRHTACKGTTGLDSGSGTGQVFSTGACQNPSVPVNPSGPSGPETSQDIGSETGFWPSWEGYNYLSDQLASKGYTVISPSAGALVTYDGTAVVDAGAIARSEIIANTLDLIKGWNEGVPTPAPTATQTAGGSDGLGTDLAGKLDLSTIAMMGHSRGGEGVTQFIEYNRQRPEGGNRYNLTGVFSLAPIDRNKHYPHGTNFATLLPACDGDVSTLSGANAFERGRYADVDDPYSKFQYYVEGANHNFYNTRWPSSDRTGTDAACGTSGAALNTNIRLTPSDQRLTGLATMETFLRVYGGGEADLKPWLTDEVGYPASACPVGPPSATVHLLACEDQVKYSYIAPAGERQDIIRPDSGVKPSTASPQAPDSAGGQMKGTGFGVFDWCNPDPFSDPPSANPPATQTTTPQDVCEGPGTPTTSFNRSFGPQLALAWDSGTPATLAATLRGSARDATKYKALSFRGSVQVSDTVRNPETILPAAAYDPTTAAKDFRIALVDRDGNEVSIKLTDIYPHGLESTLGSVTATGQPRHEVLNGFRIPLTAFAGAGVDLSDLDRVEFRFGGAGVSDSGAIQFSTLAFQELADPPPTVTTRSMEVPTSPLPGDTDLPPVDGVVTGYPEFSTPAGACVDTVAPRVKVKKAKGRSIAGSAKDSGCAAGDGLSARAGTIKRVQVTVGKETSTKGECRFVIASGKLLKPSACTIPMSTVATGGKSWKLKLGKRLKRGKYKVIAVAIDGAGNVSDTSTSRIRVR